MSDNAHRVEFTREMKKDYTILTPNMAPIHFELIKNVLESDGYHIELLRTTGREIADEGLKYVHNDTCYPALLSIGQLMHALHSGKYDLHKVALIMTQTGGGCRASNYIHLLRKALHKDGLDFIPVISVNLSGLESNPGFKITLPLLRKAIAALTYGDLLMLLKNQVKPYEVMAGASDALVEQWIGILTKLFEQGKAFTQREVREYFDRIAQAFAAIPVNKVKKTKVGIVGEIYVKYSALANNHLEDFSVQPGVRGDGARHFGLYDLQGGQPAGGYRLVRGEPGQETGVLPAEVVLPEIREGPDRRGEEVPPVHRPRPLRPPEGAGRAGHRLWLQDGRGVAAHRGDDGAHRERV